MAGPGTILYVVALLLRSPAILVNDLFQPFFYQVWLEETFDHSVFKNAQD